MVGDGTARRHTHADLQLSRSPQRECGCGAGVRARGRGHRWCHRKVREHSGRAASKPPLVKADRASRTALFVALGRAMADAGLSHLPDFRDTTARVFLTEKAKRNL